MIICSYVLFIVPACKLRNWFGKCKFTSSFRMDKMYIKLSSFITEFRQSIFKTEVMKNAIVVGGQEVLWVRFRIKKFYFPSRNFLAYWRCFLTFQKTFSPCHQTDHKATSSLSADKDIYLW